jgi:hypothetical protein
MADTENLLAKRGPGRPKEIKTKVGVVEAKPKVEVSDAEVSDTDKVVLTGAELKALKTLLSAKPEAQDAGLVGALVEALRESRKPYKSDADKQNDAAQAEQMRKTIQRQLRNTEIEQTYCKHMAGTNSLSDVPHPANAFTAIAWHDITNQLRWGICTVCQRQFWPTDSDYRYWRSKKSYNSVSKAGERDNVDVKTWELEQHPEPFGTRTGVDPRKVIQEANAIQF